MQRPGCWRREFVEYLVELVNHVASVVGCIVSTYEDCLYTNVAGYLLLRLQVFLRHGSIYALTEVLQRHPRYKTQIVI